MTEGNTRYKMKLGPHIILSTQAALDWSQRAPIVKALNDPGSLKQAQPGAVTIFRQYFTVNEQDRLDVDFTINKIKILTALGGFKPTFVELLNETHQRVVWGLADYAAFTWACVKRLHAVGQMVAGFSFSTGQPEMGDWQFLAQYDPPFAGVDALAIHEYWNGRTGQFSTWNALRYRRVHELLGGEHPPFVITECGADAVEGREAGWRKCGISGEQYVNQLLAYNAELEKDDYVIGATPFTSGPTPNWQAFGLDGDSWRIPGGTPQPIRFWRPSMAWDRHQIFDAWEKSIGGQGFNPTDAFGQFMAGNPSINVGVFVGPQLGYDRPDWGGKVVQYTTTGILVYVPGQGATFATREDQLPLA